MGQDEQAIFGDIHPDAFKLFSGSARYFYADLLEHLSEDLFLDAGFVGRPQVVEAIRNFLSAYKSRPEFEDAGSPKTDPSIRANMIYGRLLETGWIVEQQASYKRLADMDPAARLLLDFLLDIKAGRLRSYGGEVIQVLSLLESADRDPEGRSEALRGAAKSSRSFLNHLRGLSAGMRKAEEALSKQSNFGGLFETFFRDYVERHLIEDYKLLHTKANPFRFRVRILEIADRLLADEYKLEELSKAFVREGRALTVSAARKTVIEHLRRIMSVFEGIDTYLDVIEETNRRVEKKIRNTVRFLDSIREANTEGIERLLEKLGQANLEEINIPDGGTLTELPLGGPHLFTPAAQREAIKAPPIHRPVMSPAFRAYKEAVHRYRERSQVTPDRVTEYLARHLGARTQAEAIELPIENLDDFFVFERLRSLEYLSGGALSKEWMVLPAEGRVENDWISCHNFTIARRS